MWVRPLADSDAACGGKALGLARLIAAGLPVPEGFVIDDRAFRHAVGDLALDDPDAIGHVLEDAALRIAETELPEELVVAVSAQARALGMLAVRSSATIEDSDAGAAAGVFSSVTEVAARDVWQAIHTVWTSALTPLAATYARRRGGAIAVGVIVQRFVPGDRITVYTRPPGEPHGREVWVQIGEHVRKVDRDENDPVVALALRAEQAIGAPAGADVELVDDPHGGVVIVQARPIVHRTEAPRQAPPPMVLAPLVADGRRWSWDVAHNPDPLSPAQAGLVDRVERAGIGSHAMRVCAGYLYSAPRGAAPARPVIADRAELEARAAILEQAIASTLDVVTPSLDDAIDRYLAFYRIWAGELGPLIAAARAGLAADDLEGARPSAVEATLVAAARGELDEAGVIDRIGVLAPAWDVAVPTFAERPGVIRDAIARARAVVAPMSVRGAPAALDAHLQGDTTAPPAALDAHLAEDTTAPPAALDAHLAGGTTAPPAALDAHLAGGTTAPPVASARDPRSSAREVALVDTVPAASARDPRSSAREVALVDTVPRRELARAGADLAERDDVWFARAQWMVRRALIARASELGIATETVFWLPMDEVMTATALDPDDARRRAAASRTASERASRWEMPRVVGGGGDEPRQALHGSGTGGRVTGRVVRFASLASAVAVGPGDVIVTRAITPALAVFVVACAAIVSETGGPLDHGAALARELGIPCVVGCHQAWSLLGDGTVVTVDGRAGTVST